MFRRFILVVSLCLIVGGCSGYRAAALPGVDDASDRVALEVGQSARVELVTGERQTGEIEGIDESIIVLGYPSNYGYQKVMIPVTDVESIEVQEATRTESTILGIAVGTSVLAALFAIMVGLSMSGMAEN